MSTTQQIDKDGQAELLASDFDFREHAVVHFAGDGAKFERSCGSFCEGCPVCGEELF